ncbi:amino acid adenylation domain-containing protein [Flavobacterium sp. LS1R47]|uniref:Amino acid adenylation domain-containing protein n=1 Tax=Flavobacterium frigoritolerans TaxID=2987686 RepID=A0A9X3HNE1_9FLAO|nr:non-ribosomal peptide synthetase [Flavobacterium frigoritolerans]MCV9934567.1 amino acid adenylation domain-containing protein [Flavobacterium frigoritolerans]
MDNIEVIKLIYDFKKNDSLLWVEGNDIQLLISDNFKSLELRDTIIKLKSEIVSFLFNNKILSEDDFLNKRIFKTDMQESLLSFAQERLWFIEQYEQGTNVYHLPAVYELDTTTDKEGIKYALQQIVSRHEVLRSTIEYGKKQEGGIQVVHNEPLSFEEIVLGETDDCNLFIKEDINQPFNLNKEYPIRVKFYTIKSDSDNSLKTLLLITTHHIVSDGWSIEVFQKELSAYYEAYIKEDKNFRLPDLEIQYKDYALWQRSNLTGEILEKQLNYWKEKLSGFQTLEFPTNYRRPAEIDYSGALHNFRINKEISQKLRALAQRHGVTLNSLILTSVNILLGKYTGQDDIVVGSINAGRSQRQTQDLIGFFISTQANRTLLTNSQSFEELIQQVHQDQTDAQLNQDLPFEKLIDELGVERDASRHPIFQVMCGVQSFEGQFDNSEQQNNYLKACQIEGVYEVEKFDFSIFINDSQEELSGEISYATSLFDKESISRLSDHYIYLLEQLAQTPNKAYSEISLLTSVEYNQLVYNWNATEKEYPKDKTIQELFEEQVEKTPNNVAIVFENKSLTYQELNEKSNQLAHHIREQYQEKTQQLLTPDTLIALFLDRSLEMVIGILAVLKAGGAYVPIDPSYPQERIDYILEDTQATIVLSQRHLDEKPLPQEKVVYIDLTEELYKNEDNINLGQQSQSTDLAYVIYTSGTTGKPKGVMIEHKAASNTINNLFSVYDEQKIKRVTAYTSYVFDVSVSELFSSLLQGLELHILSNSIRIDSVGLSNYFSTHKINLAYLPPVLLSQLEQNITSDLISLIYAGEPCDKQTAKLWSGKVKLFNYYGPTEASIYAIGKQILTDEVEQIGQPIQNTQVYVLSSNQMPVPIGVIGELYLGGAGLSRGYLNRPELTAERFVNNPFATEADKAKGYTKLYKTGDLVRWLADGNIEYLGRNDDQVKIRGYRIELGEIEHAISQIDGINQACVLAKERKTETATTKYLVGYYVSDCDMTSVDIQNRLLEVLPDYMVPSALVVMESFPLTINGKLDKRALPDPEFTSSEVDYVAPTTEIETAVCEIWMSLLALDRVGITDDFFKIGGNSILAIQASHRMSQLLGSNVKVADIFKYKTISKLLVHATGQSQIIIPKINSNQGTLSFAQERLWFIEQYEQGTNAYHMPGLYELDVTTDKEGIKYALQQIVSRHEVLRSTIEQSEDQEHGIQKVHNEALSIEEVRVMDTDDYHSLIEEDINRPFNLSTEYPIRITFYTIESAADDSVNKTILLITMHHIASDGWSMEIFQRELSAYYEAYISNDKNFSLPELEIQYKDYALWQRSYLTGEILEKQLSYWKEKLSGFQTLEFPTDYARPAEIDYRGNHQEFTLDKRLSQKLRSLAHQYGITLNSLMLSSVNILLSKYTGQNDIVIGTAIANRHHRQTEGLIGFFVNTQAHRTQLTTSQSFEALIQQVHQEQINTQLHQDLPFEKLIDELEVERDASRHPVFQVMFGLQNFGTSERTSNDQKNYLKPFQVEDVYEVAKFDLSIFIDDSEEELAGGISYATSLFHKDTIVRLTDHYVHLLEELTKAPNKAYNEISLLTSVEYNQLVYNWNATEKEYPKDKTIQELFEEQVEKTPNNVAIVFENKSLTYRELNEKSNQLARYIREQYQEKTQQLLTPDTLIALFLDRSLEMVIGILAVLKAGGAYVPIDPSYPQERIDYILEDTQAAIVLSQRHLDEKTLPQDKVVYIDLTEELYLREDNINLGQQSESTDLAYVIYTSGTTGKPKGVMIEHKAASNTINNLFSVYDEQKIKRVTAYTSYVFDVSVSELFSSLLQGLELHILSNSIRVDSIALSNYFSTHKINLAYLPPVLLSQLEQNITSDLISLIYAGEPCDKQTAKLWSGKVKLFNYYGPTEASIYALGKQILTDEVEQIGQPIQNTQVYVLSSNQMPVPTGVIGELYLGGAGLSRGYLNRPELTAERFVNNPFATEADKAKGYTKLYKTGDLVRWLADGNIEYLGRNDDQVKIRGYRIELGEIEHAMSQIDGINQVCVLAKERKTETATTKYLVGYYVSDYDMTSVDIQNKLSEVLPDYMVPTALVAMESFPLTINGKLDKRALPNPEFTSSGADYVAPTTEIETAVCEIWMSLLALDRVGITDDFFKIGGNSILAIQASHRMSKVLGSNVKVADIFKFKIISLIIEKCKAKKVNDENISFELSII